MKHTGTIAIVLAIGSAIGMALVLLGARFEIWQPVTGFGFYRSYFNPLAMIITGVGLFALVIHLHRSEKPKAALGGVAMIFGVICLVPMISNIVNPKPRAAPIHNISTDTVNPPAFLVLDETRAGARNPLAYGGAEQAAAQTAAYPDIGPLETELTADAAYQRALTVAQDMGWDIIAADTDAHRFEATARTSVFYFADDVVVVVSSTATGSRVDMRSVSRIGRSDQGVNAARIRLFQKQFNEGV